MPWGVPMGFCVSHFPPFSRLSGHRSRDNRRLLALFPNWTCGRSDQYCQCLMMLFAARTCVKTNYEHQRKHARKNNGERVRLVIGTNERETKGFRTFEKFFLEFKIRVTFLSFHRESRKMEVWTKLRDAYLEMLWSMGLESSKYSRSVNIIDALIILT